LEVVEATSLRGRLALDSDETVTEDVTRVASERTIRECVCLGAGRTSSGARRCDRGNVRQLSRLADVCLVVPYEVVSLTVAHFVYVLYVRTSVITATMLVLSLSPLWPLVRGAAHRGE